MSEPWLMYRVRNSEEYVIIRKNGDTYDVKGYAHSTPIKSITAEQLKTGYVRDAPVDRPDNRQPESWYL